MGDRTSDAQLEKLSREAEAKDRIARMSDTIAMLKEALNGPGGAGGGIRTLADSSLEPVQRIAAEDLSLAPIAGGSLEEIAAVPGLVASLQASNDAKAVAGTLNIFGEAWDAARQGNWSQAWAHLNYEPSDAARAAVYARVFPQPNPVLARIDAAAGGPMGAASVLLTQNSSARDQYYAAQVGSQADMLAAGFGGKQVLTAKRPCSTPTVAVHSEGLLLVRLKLRQRLCRESGPATA